MGRDDQDVLGEIDLAIAGLGIIIYSPASAAHIGEGEDYLECHYWEPGDVERHVLAGTIVGFSTGTPGTFVLRVRSGYPTAEQLAQADHAHRLGLRCDGVVVFRDLYELAGWTAEFPPEQSITLDAGTYHVTLTTSEPASGVLGDHQVIDVYLQPLAEFPELAPVGVPQLCS